MTSLLSPFLTAVVLLLLARYYIARQENNGIPPRTVPIPDHAAETNQRPGSRLAWIDCAKGLTMLLVILGHTINTSQNPFNHILRGLIFSFHMPLFFILSGAAARLSADSGQFLNRTERTGKYLITTAMLLFAADIAVLLHKYAVGDWKNFLANTINTIVYGSGIEVHVGSATIPAFGMEWFLLVLFCGKTLYDYLHLKLTDTRFYLSIVFCASAGAALGNIQWLPWSLDITLAVIPFFWCGSFLKDLHLQQRRSVIFAGAAIIWLTTFYLQYSCCHDYLRISSRNYPLFPLCFITAAAGTVTVSQVCWLLSSCRHIKLLLFLGRNSLYLYCAHSLDYLSLPLWFCTDSIYINNLLRTALDVIVCIILVKAIEFIKNKTAPAQKTS